MKVTEPGLNKLIDNLNTLICEDSLLTRQERETLVLAVAAIGAMKARVGLKKGDAPTVARREKREKKDRQPDPRFPRAGHPWQEDEKTLLSDALDSVPDEEIGKHLFWLSEKLGRTPFSVAFQIAAIRELQDGWEEQFREISDNIRLSGLILEMACKAAENVILDRRVFNFNDEQYAEFIDMLDAPVEDDSAINKLLARKPQWDV